MMVTLILLSMIKFVDLDGYSFVCYTIPRIVAGCTLIEVVHGKR